MSVSTDTMNEAYQPTENDEEILAVLKEGRDEGEPWGRANPRYLVDETPLSKGNVEFSLKSLTDAGWITRVTRGLYELRGDPRENHEPDQPTDD